MKKLLLIIELVIISTFLYAQTSDSLELITTALNYAEGWYTGDPIRMEKAIHPELNKAFPRKINPASGMTLTYASYSYLIEGCRAKRGLLDSDKRKIGVKILNVDNDFANVRLTSSQFNDYLQMIKINGQWKIVNVLWNFGPDSERRDKDFRSEADQEELIKASQMYIESIMLGNADLFQTIASQDYSRLTYNYINQTNNIFINRTTYNTIVEQCRAKFGIDSETKLNCDITVLDAMDGMSVIKVKTTRQMEYLQLYKDGSKWKVFHAVQKSNPEYSFTKSLPALINHPMEDFTLPVYQGSSYTLSQSKGKNVMLFFPRGWIADHWCQVCQYQYAEILDLVRSKNLLRKYNLEIMFVLPYSKEKIDDWVKNIPKGINKINEWKLLQGNAKEFANFISSNFTSDLNVESNDLTVPILIDADRKLSIKLQLFTTFWDGIKSEQNIPTIFIIDKNGNVQFKYHSQTTFDRPSSEYLISILKTVK